MSSTEDWLSEIQEQIWCGALDAKEMKREFQSVSDYETAYIKYKGNVARKAKAKIRQHMLSEALVLIGEDDNEVRGTTQSPDNPNYWTKRTKHRNELKAELRQAFTEKYGERE